MQYYDILKSFHIIFIVTWFAGLFNLGRLFIYYVEANTKDSTEKMILQQQFSIMQRRLWYVITVPSAILTFILGTSLVILTPEWLKEGWLHAKLFAVILLYSYHFCCGYIRKNIHNIQSALKLRYFNEVPVLFLFSIVFLVILKNSLSAAKLGAAVIVIMIGLMAGIQLWKKARSKYNV